MPGSVIARRAGEMLEVFSMTPHRNSTIGTYSKGMRQRILLIAALMHNPDLIVFDEPLSGLDVTSSLIFRELVKALSLAGKTIFYCSHVLEVVERVCSHVIILQKGKQLAYGTVDDLKTFQQMPTLEAAFAHLVQEDDAPASASGLGGGHCPLNEDLKSPFVWLPQTPFGSLVAYFVKRLFASEEETRDEEMSLGLGRRVCAAGIARRLRVFDLAR